MSSLNNLAIKMKRAISEIEKEQRKEQIVFAALDEFYLKGLKATKMEDIAIRCGISKGTLYLYFSSKKALFESAVEHIAMHKAQQIQSLMTNHNSVKEALDQLFEFIPKVIIDSPLPKLIKVLISDAFDFPDVIKTYKQNIIDQVLSTITIVLQAGKERGEVNIDDAALTAKLIVAPVIFAVVWKVLSEAENSPPLAVDVLLKQHQLIIYKALGITE
ncbi:TetR/AcrR family transcriptional regulator [Psychrosphaera sp. 1_MG-2023]|nr:TetR/AcrR family transcriptional regulator [Psychrosphaera sp. 1_MG-2023]